MDNNKVYIGKIVSTHGIKGEIRILSNFDYKDKVFKVGNKLIIENQDYTIKSYRKHKNYDMVTLNNFNNIDEIYVWVTVSEDVKNNLIKFNIRSRGPVINTIAEKYNGGGHKYASGARVSDMDVASKLLKDLDNACIDYLKEEEDKDEV